MSRLKQNQIIDSAISSIATIAENQCSLSEADLVVVNEALRKLQILRRKKGRTNEQIRKEIASVVLLLIEFFATKTCNEIQMPNQ